MQKCEDNGYTVVYKSGVVSDAQHDEYTGSKDTGKKSKEADKKWLEKTFNQIWKRKTKLILRDLLIFGNEAEYSYPAKIVQEAYGLIIPLSQCPSDLHDEMKWYF